MPCPKPGSRIPSPDGRGGASWPRTPTPALALPNNGVRPPDESSSRLSAPFARVPVTLSSLKVFYLESVRVQNIHFKFVDFEIHFFEF